MRTRPLGRTGIELPVIGYGAMGLDWAYGHTEPDHGVHVLRRAFALGARHVDTADMYGPFTNEELVGRAIAGRREDVVLATKCGLVTKDARTYAIERNGKPEHIREACDASLKRLGSEQIDLYYLHRVDPEVPVEESVGALAELVHAGKVRAIGLSETDVSTLERAHAVHPVSALQSELSLWTRGPLQEVIPWCARHDVTFVAFSPLGRGFLTGRYRSLSAFAENDFRRTLPRFQKDALEDNLRIADAVEQVADARGVPTGNVALAWVLACGDNVVAIPGTKTIAYLEENVAAAGLELTVEELAALDELPTAVGGVR